MAVNMQVTLGLDGQIECGMARQLIKHVVEKADAGRKLALPAAVEIDDDTDLRLLRFAHDFGSA
jgi:hypothetical protein